MGGKHGKEGNKQERVKIAPTTVNDLNETDFQFLVHQTGHTRAEIKQLFDRFSEGNTDLKLNRAEFSRLYIQLRPESPELLDEITEFIFSAFDADRNGTIDFNEFMVRVCIKKPH
jgi:Ca2+-binding EF-hand superfamily protein